MLCVLFSFQWRRKEKGLFYALKQENVLGKKQFFGQAGGVARMANEDKKDFNAMLNDCKDMPKIQTITDEKSIQKYGGNRMYFAQQQKHRYACDFRKDIYG
jgi:hypothetical protein